MDIKDIQEQAFERRRIAGRREAIEELLPKLESIELGEDVTVEQVVEDLLRCGVKDDCSCCHHLSVLSTYCISNLMRDAAAVIKALLCGGAVADANVPRAPVVLLVGKEPIKVGNTLWGRNTTVYKCPKCGKFVLRYGNYCYECGQALDWQTEAPKEESK